MRRLATFLLIFLFSIPQIVTAQKPIRVYISADMEGVAGVVTADQLLPGGFEYEHYREIMTDEVLAAIQGARDAGATEFVVSDSHGNGENLLIDKFPSGVRIVRSWPRPLGMMQGIDSTFDAAIFVGYHASTTNPNGVRAHTFSSAHYASVALNGKPMTEGGVNAAIAGYFGVPVVMVSGDNEAVKEVQQQVGDGMEGAVVKQFVSFHAANTLTPADAQALIRAKAKAGVERRASMKPMVVSTPVTLDLVFKNYRPAQVLAYLPIVQRTTSHGIRYTAPNMVEMSRFLEFISAYNADLEP